jgi:DNA polymerase-3 subunit delta'
MARQNKRLILMELSPWLKTSWQSLQQVVAAGRIPASLLIEGPSGLGPETLVSRYISAIMCQGSDDEPCGFCHACDLIKSNNHPDIHWLKPEDGKSVISVEQIRQSNRWAQETSQLGGYRVIIIEPAEAMNESASNALLKTLEEPASKCLFVLLSRNSHQLLPTIRSRCEVWSLPLPSEAMVLDWVRSQTQKSVPNYVVMLNSYLPLTTLRFVNDGWERVYSECEQELVSFLRSDRLDTAPLWKQISKAEVPLVVILGWYWVLLVACQKQAFNLSSSSLLPGVSDVAQQLTYEVAYVQASRLQELIEQLSQNPGLNAELLVVNWLYQFD